MTSGVANALARSTELDRTKLPEFLERIGLAEAEGTTTEPRTYPGYPRWELPRLRPRRWVGLDLALAARRCQRRLDTATPDRRVLARLLQFSHAVTADQHRGPTPSAGGLQAIELYLVHFDASWLPAGLYHYDRVGHHLSQLAAAADRDNWAAHVPSLRQVEGGSFVWMLVGDLPRVAAKYGERGVRFLLVEAGHLMQNLCVLSTSLALSTVPLGGFLERAMAREFGLPASDVVLYVGVCGIVL